MDEKTSCMATTNSALELKMDAMLDLETKHSSSARKFSRIRAFVQNVNDEFLSTLYSCEQRHNAEVKQLQEALVAAEQRHQAEAKRLKEIMDGALFAVEQRHEAETKLLRDSLDAAEQRHNTASKQLSDRVESALVAVQQRHENEVKQVQDSMENAIFEAEQRHEEEVEQLRDALFAAEQSHKQEIKKLRDRMDYSEQGHQEEVKSLREHLDIQTETVSVLQQRIVSLQGKEQEHVELIKQASDKIRKLEALEESHKNYVKLAGAKITDLTNEDRRKEQIANEKIRVMEAREDKVVALAKKAALKIKELEARNKVQTANAEQAAGSFQKLKHMLLAKHDDLEAVKESALRQFDALAEALVEASKQRVLLQASLSETRDQYLEEHELRKADQKKIASLRKMIEHYDGDGESTWPDLSHALTEDTYATPLALYRDGSVQTKDDFEKLRRQVYDAIPEGIKGNYNQVGFFRTNGYYFPVLALGPFDVPPGQLRKQWLAKATTSLGVYYYGQANAALAYDIIPGESFIPYEEGVSQGFHITPGCITEKSMSGQDLSPIEKIFKTGMQLIVAEANSEPEARSHVLKNFKEAFELEEIDLEAVIDSNILRDSFKETISSSIKSFAAESTREDLLAELQQLHFCDTDTKVPNATKRAGEKVTTSLRINTDNEPASYNDDAASCADSVATPASTWDMDSCATVTSLEDQMYSFMRELASANKRLPRNALPKKKLEKCNEASGDDDARDDAEQSESIPSFQQRLKMFSGVQSSVTSNVGNHRNTVASNSPSNTKSVMQMWQQKAASTIPACTTPKQGNKNINATASKDSNARSVMMPKNLLKKIEAGEELNDQERAMLLGIQKLSQISPASSSVDDLEGSESADSKHTSRDTFGEIIKDKYSVTMGEVEEVVSVE
jgi:hypothetical protein